MRAALWRLLFVTLAATTGSAARAQNAPPPPQSLEDVTSCSVEGAVVFIGVGKGVDARRYKYPWDASIDALCNAKGFAISAPAKSSNSSPSASPRSVAPPVVTQSTGQAGSGAAFPPSSVVPTSQELSAFLAGKTFVWSTADGTRVRSKFGADGGLAASAPGFYDTGKWRVEDGKLCGSTRKAGEFCNDARFDAGKLYMSRMYGDIIRYEPE